MNLPLRYTDPSGHHLCDSFWDCDKGWTANDKKTGGKPQASSTQRTQVIQVNLSTFKRRNQYEPMVTAKYGNNACGLVAVAGPSKDNYDGLLFNLGDFAMTQGFYGPQTGIQPSKLAETASNVLGGSNVSTRNEWGIDSLYDELANGSIVIVDIQVGAYSHSDKDSREFPTTEGNNYAHFARVLGVDLIDKKVYIENTLSSSYSPHADEQYWSVDLDTFSAVWEYPETSATFRVEGAENVTRWALVVDPAAYSSETR